MCGICGMFNFEREKSVDEECLRRMTSLLVHRGPDGEGIALLGQAGLGHRRLSIIDLLTGDQPMLNEDRSLCLVFNGEIYNFKRLRKELESHGHRFSTHSDTEVILHLYEDYGEQCIDHLRGMFAFALWDKTRRRLILARDRAGMKPLYYTVFDDTFYFASELKALLAVEGLPRELNAGAIHDFLTYQYVPAPGTVFKNVYKLPHAHCLVVEGPNLRPRRYWQLDYEPKWETTGPEAIDRVEGLLCESVGLRLQSDVPVGIFLSGGIDSSLVVAMARRHVSGPLRTFSIGFEHEEYNELPYARQVAERYDTEHHEFMIKADHVDVLPKLVWHFDEPYADASALPTFYLSQMTRQYVTVALNGDGGDESFAGYERYFVEGTRRYQAWCRIPVPLRRFALRPGLNAMRKLVPRSRLLTALGNVNTRSLADAGYRYAHTYIIFPDWMKARMYTPEFAAEVGHRSSLEWMMGRFWRDDVVADVDRKLNTDIMTYLPECLLPKVDRTTMAVGLEGRSPFLDQELMAYAARLPEPVKICLGTTKPLLRQLAERHLPQDIIWRKKKGFGAPTDLWFRNEMRGFARELLLSERATSRGFFRPSEIAALLREHEHGTWNHCHRLWALVTLEVWCRTFLDRRDIMAGGLSGL